MLKNQRDLPQINTLLERPEIKGLVDQYSHAETVNALRKLIGIARDDLIDNEGTNLNLLDNQELVSSITLEIEADRAHSLRSVINATGIIIHTNLGRARMAPEAVRAMHSVAGGPSNLELDLKSRKRGSRHAHVEKLVCALTGAEAAVVVNNCAAAVLLSLMATAGGRNVIASRGELIEIGGSFRLPDVIAQSGSVLREVGATNKTRLSDYAAAIDTETAVLLKSHTSNYKIVGFTSTPDREKLAQLAKENEIILMEDLGSGVLVDLAPFGLVDEPVVSDIIKAGVDLVMFSGDKLLGGPQAGIIAGRKDIVSALKSHPLMRAIRIDKLSLAALEATLRLYRPPFDPVEKIPVLRMLSEPLSSIRKRAEDLCLALKELGLLESNIIESKAQVGGGTLPGQELESFAVTASMPSLSPDQLSIALSNCRTPVITRIKHDKVIFDLRSVTESETSLIVDAMAQIVKK